MTHRLRFASLALAACAAVCFPASAFAAVPAVGADVPRFLGRLHPLVVHFPIALLVVAVIAEVFAIVLRRERSRPSTTGLACVVLGAIGAAAAAWFGWINADLEPHGRGVADQIEVHRWLGVAAAGLAAVALFAGAIGASGRARVMTAAYRVTLVLGAALVAVAAHWGGTIVYGPGYLTEVLFPEPAPTQVETHLADVQSLPSGLTVDFATQIAPIFADHCIECHGPTKKKGGLRLDDRASALGRDPDEQIIVPGDAMASDLFFRVTLPRDDEDAMPPEGKGEPLSPEEIALVETWINEGAVWIDTPTTGPETVADGAAEPATREFVFDDVAKAAQEQVLARLRERGAVAVRVSAADPSVEVRFDLLGKQVTDEDLALISGLEPTLVALNLAGTSVTDDGLAALEPFHNLERLHLDRTDVTDAGLAHLGPLGELTYLNLYGTQISDQGLVPIASLPKLSRLYVWKTNVSAQAGQLLAALKPGLTVEVASELKPAVFDAVAQEPAEQAAPASPAGAVDASSGGVIDVALLAPCCKAAAEKGAVCDHPCCVEARAAGKICEQCSQ